MAYWFTIFPHFLLFPRLDRKPVSTSFRVASSFHIGIPLLTTSEGISYIQYCNNCLHCSSPQPLLRRNSCFSDGLYTLRFIRCSSVSNGDQRTLWGVCEEERGRFDWTILFPPSPPFSFLRDWFCHNYTARHPKVHHPPCILLIPSSFSRFPRIPTTITPLHRTTPHHTTSTYCPPHLNGHLGGAECCSKADVVVLGVVNCLIVIKWLWWCGNIGGGGGFSDYGEGGVAGCGKMVTLPSFGEFVGRIPRIKMFKFKCRQIFVSITIKPVYAVGIQYVALMDTLF